MYSTCKTNRNTIEIYYEMSEMIDMTESVGQDGMGRHMTESECHEVT